jgi:hypothetical protein
MACLMACIRFCHHLYLTAVLHWLRDALALSESFMLGLPVEVNSMCFADPLFFFACLLQVGARSADDESEATGVQEQGALTPLQSVAAALVCCAARAQQEPELQMVREACMGHKRLLPMAPPPARLLLLILLLILSSFLAPCAHAPCVVLARPTMARDPPL